MTNKDIYRCYSTHLKSYLSSHGIYYFLVANDIVTGRKFYAFEKNKEFLDAMKMWESSNPKS